MNAEWQDFLTTLGARVTDGRVQHFGDPEAELQATASASIITDLSHLALLQVDGTDAVTFLQGQLTNDIKSLDGGQYAGYCTAKGRLLAIFLAVRLQEQLYLQVNGALKDSVLKRLKLYVLRSQVSFSDASDTIHRIGLAGAQAEALLSRAFQGVPQQAHQLLELDSVSLLRLPGALPRFEIFVAAEKAAALWTQLHAGCTAVGAACWYWLEIQAGIPDIAVNTQEAFVPQMVNLDLINGISFKKGCYTGQEIVARTHYLGKVKRRTYLLHGDLEQLPQAGEPLFNDVGQDAIGQVVRAAAAPEGGFDLLAELRSESTTGSIHYASAAGTRLTLLPLPYPVE